MLASTPKITCRCVSSPGFAEHGLDIGLYSLNSVKLTTDRAGNALGSRSLSQYPPTRDLFCGRDHDHCGTFHLEEQGHHGLFFDAGHNAAHPSQCSLESRTCRPSWGRQTRERHRNLRIPGEVAIQPRNETLPRRCRTAGDVVQFQNSNHNQVKTCKTHRTPLQSKGFCMKRSPPQKTKTLRDADATSLTLPSARADSPARTLVFSARMARVIRMCPWVVIFTTRVIPFPGREHHNPPTPLPDLSAIVNIRLGRSMAVHHYSIGHPPRNWAKSRVRILAG